MLIVNLWYRDAIKNDAFFFFFFIFQTQPPRRGDLPGGTTGQSFIAPVLRKKQTSIEETTNIDSNSDMNPTPSPSISSPVTLNDDTPKLYQNYGKEPKV